MRISSLFSVVIVLAYLIGSTCYCHANEISNRIAKKVINDHIGVWYCPIDKELIYQKKHMNNFNRKIDFLSKIKNLNLINFNVAESKYRYKITVSPSNDQYIISENNNNNEFALPAGNRYVEKIVKIDEDIVYFSGSLS